MELLKYSKEKERKGWERSIERAKKYWKRRMETNVLCILCKVKCAIYFYRYLVKHFVKKLEKWPI